MASSAEFQELKTLILGVDKKVGDFSEKLDNVERNLKTMVNEVKADVNVLKVKCNTSITDIKELRRDFTELERGVSAMDLQVQEIENEKLEKQKTDLQKQIDSLSEKVVLLEKHERKYNILIYGIDDRDQDENIYAVTRHLFTQELEIDHRKAQAIPIANAHRLPTRSKGPKPIIVRFLHFGDKQLVMSRAHKLAGKQIRILDDLPVSMKEERFLLSHVAYKIRKNEKLQTRIRDNGAHMMLETRKSISDKWSRRE